MLFLLACSGPAIESRDAAPPAEPAHVGWLLAQPAGESGMFGAVLPGSAMPSGTVTAWRWPDTRTVPDGDEAPATPPPIRQAPLEEVRLTVVGVQEQDGVRILTMRGPEDLDEPVVTRLRDEHGVVVGARQQVYRAFSLTCEEVGIAPLPLDRAAKGRVTCVRLPLDDGWLVATEHPTGPEETCTVWALVGADGARSALSTECRDDLLADAGLRQTPERRERLREHLREHLAEMAFSSGAGPSSPEAWFREEGGEIRVLVNRFRGVTEERCLAALPAPGAPWRTEGCVPGRSLGP